MIPTIRTAVLRTSSIRGSLRAFSSNCEPANRIRCIFEEYRQEQWVLVCLRMYHIWLCSNLIDNVLYNATTRHFTHTNAFCDFSWNSFSRETPNRFRKELLKAVEKEGCTKGAVEVDALNAILVNIGRPEERLTEAELDAILAEAGVAAEDRVIPVDKMIQLM